ncbi:MAG: hypothetical protein COA79_13610 [Planctomycetota bacterium]|nr:MAG: hypothetical protein COA79_13610 [Planctomycetota bacterium]
MKTLTRLFVFLIFLNFIQFSSVNSNDYEGMILLPKVIQKIAKNLRPSIVTIEGFGGLLDSSIRGDGKFKKRVRGFSKPGEGPTTGVIISEDGYIITSTFNFIREPKIITVTLNNGKKFNAKLLGKDNTRKICVLKIAVGNEKLKVPEFITGKKTKVGQWSVSIGLGYGGDKAAISVGLISGKNRVFGKAIQTDANISPANYGGPLVNVDGKIIGICTPLSPMGQDAFAGFEWYDSGIGFVIPIADCGDIIDRLKNKIDVNFGKLGIHVTIDKKFPKKVMVDLVMPDSPAEKAGLKSGDLIQKINSHEIEYLNGMKKILGRFESGSKIVMDVKRNNKSLQLKIILGSGKDLLILPKEKIIDKKIKKKKH